MKKLRLIILTSLLLCCTAEAAPVTSDIDDILLQLDNTLKLRQAYVQNRQNRIVSLEDMLTTTSLEQQYLIYRRLYNEYYTFNFDNALRCLEKGLAIADSLGDYAKTNETYLELALLYTTSGMYLEANDTFIKVDTLRFDNTRKLRFYESRVRFYRDFREYTKNSELSRYYSQELTCYRNLIYKAADGSDLARFTKMLELYDSGDYAEAKTLAENLIEHVGPQEHAYAIYAYYLGTLAEAESNLHDQIIWYARSAVSDMQLAVKDNASLCSLANILFKQGEIERAFSYINYSIDDALYYNAKLRPWQIASVMPTIEQSYQAYISARRKAASQMMNLISILATVLLLICIYVAVLYRRTRSTGRELSAKNQEIVDINRQLSQINERLHLLNQQITESNTVKEEYIGLFLSMCSDYIDKLTAFQSKVRRSLKAGHAAELLRELSASNLMDTELSNFYEMFDNAFLHLYPDFVDEFNSLIEPDARIVLRKGEKLNTELRIFALIRLGINDSSKIALLLRYSVNTIYNYRAKVKNKAICNREDFEEIIKTIGSFSTQ